MQNFVDYSVQGTVAVIAFGEAPVNSLGRGTRRELAAALERAQADSAVSAIVLVGRNGTFSAGADIREFGGPDMLAPPDLTQLIGAIESSSKPVVAAVAGMALGGGLELALGCHYRVVHQDAKLGLPEVKLGLLPGAGGTQRLPRVIGVAGALNVILSGEPIPAAMFAKSPLIDRTADGDVLAAAVALAAEVGAKPGPHPRVRDRKVREPNLEALLQFARNTARAAFAKFPAPLNCIDAVAASAKSKSFNEGLAEERRLFSQLMTGSESAALRHIFFAERAAAKIDGLPADTKLRDIKSAAVIGGGTMGTGIAINFLNAGIPTALLEVSTEAADKAVARVRDTFAGQVKKGKLTPDKLDGAHGAAEARERLRRARAGRRDHRGGLRGHGRQGAGVPQARRRGEAGRDPRDQHLDAGRGQDRRLHEASRRRDRHALLQPREHHEAAGGRARREDLARGAGHDDEARQDPEEDRRGLRRLRRLHRQPHGRAVFAPGDVPASRKARACSRSTARSRSSVSRWVRSAWATWPATTSAGTSASAAASSTRT